MQTFYQARHMIFWLLVSAWQNLWSCSYRKARVFFSFELFKRKLLIQNSRLAMNKQVKKSHYTSAFLGKTKLDFFFWLLFFSLTKSFESLAHQTRIFGPECLPFLITNLTNFVTIRHPPDWARSGLAWQMSHLPKAQPHYFYSKKLKNGPELIRHCDILLCRITSQNL